LLEVIWVPWTLSILPWSRCYWWGSLAWL